VNLIFQHKKAAR